MYTYKKGCVFKSLSEIKNKHITVMGLGLNGGGEACVRFFLSKGAFVTVTDKKTQEQLKPTLEKLENLPQEQKERLNYVLGEHRLEDFENADCVIKNPGVKIEGNIYLEKAKAIETDISIFLSFSKAPIIAITGSKGKSSTVSAIYYGLKQAGFNAFLGGNITVSPLTFLEETSETTPVILELSSWQLADLRGRGVLKPKISLITKIVPDHQNWYGAMEPYVEDKELIFADQTEQDISIFDFDEDEKGTEPKNAKSWGERFSSSSKAQVLRYSKNPLPKGIYGVWKEKNKDGSFCGKILLPKMAKSEVILENLLVPGAHMKTNALNAALVMALMGIKSKKIKEILSTWQGIEHRLQHFFVFTAQNKTKLHFYNDSCATVPEAAKEAAIAFNKPVIFICGGTDKGLSFTPLTDYLCGKTDYVLPKALYLLCGSGTSKMLPELDNAKVKYYGPYENLTLLLEALKENLKKEQNNTPSEEIIVFSPGATSFELFTNEFDRGNKFMDGVKRIFV